MYFKQFYLGCLAHASYLIGSEGEAAVIDPQRDIDQYMKEAEREGLRIKYVIETHLHADFVSGHKELAEKTGAEIVFGHSAQAAFPHIAAKDGDLLEIGSIELKVFETPGHTPESISILAIDKADSDRPPILFTGDTLFIGDVGRPDLVGVKGFTAQQMASMMYDSLHDKLLKLDDSVEVYPAHGAGSLCGKNLSTERSSTIGQQKLLNYALQPMSRDAFVEMLTADQPEVPDYFPKDAELNRQGAVALDKIPRPKALTAMEVNKEMQRGAVPVDVRNGTLFASGHIKGSLNIALSGQFASWAGTLIHLGQPIVILASDQESIDEAVIRLARVGHEQVIGFLDGGLIAWADAGFEVTATPVVTVTELKKELEEGQDLFLLDVRRAPEYDAGHIEGAVNIPLSDLEGRINELPSDKPIAIICASGYRSSIAKSILERQGKEELMNVLGGFKAWQGSEYNVVVAESRGTCRNSVN
ncbi:MAG: MBL fold metallo-hydrolase [Candidatus Obscuribacterales bacterium]|nr:MBL fold metallo-hydrolase [Cyanobacteria bacterium HKST-UBA01]MCB9470466.1 MBL fold metallo-hydrolase [Candidatus Obscuribacterales bacterium]